MYWKLLVVILAVACEIRLVLFLVVGSDFPALLAVVSATPLADWPTGGASPPVADDALRLSLGPTVTADCDDRTERNAQVGQTTDNDRTIADGRGMPVEARLLLLETAILYSPSADLVKMIHYSDLRSQIVALEALDSMGQLRVSENFLFCIQCEPGYETARI
ncbi:hypothetical protein EV421DRAFT_1740480 [Armillaria borealis]|uniref:Uncharacterized protein n=1 Tax=Armillaria borealis TaxID=47425 RepID=A0AA39MHZ3_9AGAR|nr:hypothetical protein EV421DRAFT_1740480 [Armillaria borealis]